MCASCKRLRTDLDHQKHRSEVSPARKIARQKPSSHFKLQYLSPASAAVRKKATQMERSVDKARLARHEDIELLLDDEQSEELCGVMKKIEETCSDKLQEIFQEGDSHAVGKLVQESWELDKLNAKENFFKDQIKNSECCKQLQLYIIACQLQKVGSVAIAGV